MHAAQDSVGLLSWDALVAHGSQGGTGGANARVYAALSANFNILEKLSVTFLGCGLDPSCPGRQDGDSQPINVTSCWGDGIGHVVLFCRKLLFAACAMLLCYYQNINLQTCSLPGLSDSRETGNGYHDRWTDSYTPVEKNFVQLGVQAVNI